MVTFDNQKTDHISNGTRTLIQIFVRGLKYILFHFIFIRITRLMLPMADTIMSNEGYPLKSQKSITPASEHNAINVRYQTCFAIIHHTIVACNISCTR